VGFVERDMCSLGSWERGSLNGPDCAIVGGGLVEYMVNLRFAESDSAGNLGFDREI